MPAWVLSSTPDRFAVPVCQSADFNRSVANRQATASAIGFVRVRTVYEHIGMQRHLPGLQLKVFDLTVAFRIGDSLGKYHLFSLFRVLEIEVSVQV